MTRELIFVDTETTGLDLLGNEIVELTWAKLEGEPHTLYFGVEEVPDFVDKLIGFTKRGIAGIESTEEEFSEFVEACTGNTMVAANPSFDRGFLEKDGLFVFHYRMLDIESYAMAKLGLDYVPSMSEIHMELTARGLEMPKPDHTSAGDVMAMRAAYLHLRELWHW